MLRHRKLTKYYIGKTNRPLSARLQTHRNDSHNLNNQCHRAIEADPMGLEIVPLHTLYNVTDEELRAVEAWTISQHASNNMEHHRHSQAELPTHVVSFSSSRR